MAACRGRWRNTGARAAYATLLVRGVLERASPPAHKRPMLLAMFAYWGIGMPVGAGLGLWLGWGPRGMWLGLTAGLAVAAVLLARRFLRSSARIAMPATPAPQVTVTEGG